MYDGRNEADPRAGRCALAAWRDIYRGAKVALDPACRTKVEAAAATIEAIVAKGEPVYGVNTGFGKLASVRIGKDDLAALQRNIVLSHACRRRRAHARADRAPRHGAQGREPRARRVGRPLDHGRASSRMPAPRPHPAHSVARLGRRLGRPRAARPSRRRSDRGRRLPHRWRERAGQSTPCAAPASAPLVLGPKEGLALLNGTQVSTALALAGLFEAEKLLGAALVTGALSTDAAKGSDGPFDPRIQALRGHRGQAEIAAALRALMAGSAIRASHLVGDDRVQDPYCLRCQPQVMGACLDLLRQAATTLSIEANGVSDNPLVFAESGEVISGGNFHAEAVAFAADMIAMALCEIGSLSERRIAMLVDPALSRLPAFLTPKPGLNSGFMIPQVVAAALVSENKQRAYPASVDSIPTSANQEDHVSMATHGARRLLAMAENVVNILAIELLAAAQGCDFHAPLRSSPVLERVREAVRARVPRLEEDRFLAPDIAAAAELVRSEALADAAGHELLPRIREGLAGADAKL